MIIDSPIISGSQLSSGPLTQVGDVYITGSLNVLGAINGSITGSITSASYATSAEFLDGLDSTSFVFTSSFNTFSGSAAGRITNLEAFSSSLDATFATDASVSASILVLSQSVQNSQAALSSSYTITSGSYASASGSLSIRTSNLEATSSTLVSASSSFAADSASLSTRLTTDEANITTLTNASASFAVVSSSFVTTSGSISSRTNIIETSYATTGSNTFTGPQYASQASNAISFTSTASLYTDGGFRVAKDSFVSGTAYFNNITVYGTSSIQYITSSQVNIGSNVITVNTDTPAIRFGGLSVFDSGSTQLTGSIFWDSEKNHWIYSNPSGSAYNSAMLMNGPRNTGSLGDEQGTTNNALMKGQGGDHITSSQMIDDGATVMIPGALQVTGSLVNTGAATFGSSALISGVLTLSSTISNGTYTYTLPSATGTLALTSALSSYLPLAGGTLTGALYINYANPVVRFKGATLDGYIINSSDKLYIADYNTATKGMTVDLSTGALTQLGSGAVTLLGALSGTSASFSSTITSSINTGGVQNQLILENLSVAAGADGNIIYFKGYQGSLAKISAVGFPNDLVGGYLQLQSYSSNTTANIGLIINQNGNVSINNTNNSYQLDVSGTLRVTGAATFSSSIYAATTITANTTVTARLGYTTAGNSTNPSYDDALIIDPSGNGVAMVKLLGGNQFASDYGTALKFTVNGGSGPNNPIDVMTLRSTGNVGIGTTSPLLKLNVLGVNGAESGTATPSGSIAIGDMGTNNQLLTMGVLNGTPNYAWIQSRNSTLANFYTLALNPSGGNVGIGTSAPSYLLEVAGFTRTQNLRVTTDIYLERTSVSPAIVLDQADIRIVNQATGDSNTLSTQPGYLRSSSGFYANTGGGSAMGIGSISGARRLQWDDSLDEVMVLGSNNGYKAIGASAFNVRSDYRLKEDLKESNGLNEVLKIKTYNFKWIDSEERQDGFIAHELADVLPYVVTGRKDGIREDETIIAQGVDYSKLVPILVKAIQEQQTQIQALKTEINELKNIVGSN